MALRGNDHLAMQAWTPEAVADLIQIPYRTLMRWLKTGCIHASVAPPRGERKQVLLGLEEVLEVCVVATLRRAGHSMDYALVLLSRLHEDDTSLRDVYLIAMGEADIAVYHSAREASKLFGEPGQKILLPVAHWRELAQRFVYQKTEAIVA